MKSHCHWMALVGVLAAFFTATADAAPPSNTGYLPLPQSYGPAGPMPVPDGARLAAAPAPSTAGGQTQLFPNYATHGDEGIVRLPTYTAVPQGYTSPLGPPPAESIGNMGQPYSSYGNPGETLINGTRPMEAAGCSSCVDSCVPCAPAPCCPWFGGVAGLFMGRDRPNKLWTSADGDHPENQVMNTNNINNSFQGGGEVRVGRYFGGPGAGIGGAAIGGGGFGGVGNCCGGYAIEGVWWGLSPINGYAGVNAPSPTDGLVTPIILDAPPVPTIGPYNASDYFDGALRHELWRRDYFQNVELNFWRLPLFAPTQRFQANWMAGVRYFRFTDGLVFGGVSGSTTHPEIFGTEGYLDTKMINNLIGPQIGVRGNYFLTRTVSIYAQPVFGVFGNHATSQMRLYNSTGDQGFDIRGRLNDLAILGQLDLGTQWFLTPRWSVFAAYRVIGISGVGLADNQIPVYLNDTPALQDVHTNGSLIVSGGVFGTWFAY